MQLTHEERERIYLEEKARLEIRHQLESNTATATRPIAVATRPSDGLAAVLSLFLPGAGQMYKGHIGGGFTWMICTACVYFAMVVPGVILHVICIFRAFSMQPAESPQEDFELDKKIKSPLTLKDLLGIKNTP